MVYEPLEDSFLMQKWVKKLCKGKIVLDMGTGNGIQAITASQAGALQVTGFDIDPEAIKSARENAEARKVNVSFVQSDLFSRAKPGQKFDLIIFNPPYLPYDENLQGDIDLSGGEVGNELTINFLRDAKNYLSKDGFILVILSSISNPLETISISKNYGYKHEILEDQTLNFETLYCVKFIPI